LRFGSVSAAANGLFGTGATLAVFPGGTGDDFAKAIGAGKFEAAVKLLANPRSQAIDVVRLTTGVAVRHFVNVAGAGFDSEVNETANAMKINLGSTGTYMFDYVELYNFSSYPVTVPPGGWALMYGSATEPSFGSTVGNIANIPAGAVIPACGCYLVQVGPAGTGGAQFPVAPDLIAPGPAISPTTGKIALFDNQVSGAPYTRAILAPRISPDRSLLRSSMASVGDRPPAATRSMCSLIRLPRSCRLFAGAAAPGTRTTTPMTGRLAQCR